MDNTPKNFDLFIQIHTSDLLLITSAKLFITLFCHSDCKLDNTGIATLDFENKACILSNFFNSSFLLSRSCLTLTLYILRKLLKVGTVAFGSTVSRHNKSHHP